MNAPHSMSEQVRNHAELLSRDGPDCITGLIDLTSDRLIRLAIAVTGNQHDAEDVVQEVLVRVAQKPQALEAADDSWAYLLAMVRNEALAATRRKQRHQLFASLSDLVTQCRVDDQDREDQFRQVWRAMKCLPSAQSEVVVLRIWEGMTFPQIATILAISKDTAASRFRYAMQKLENALRPSWDDTPVITQGDRRS
ncbi:MAG: sigma-70 family RNA polymerase sigma factor [Planctomycetota bacterium]